MTARGPFLVPAARPAEPGCELRVDLVSEHASPLAVLGGVDAGGQNVHVAALATALGQRGATVTVHTRRESRDVPRSVWLAPGATVHHIEAGPCEPLPKDDLWPWMDAFAQGLRRRWRRHRPDLVHAHFWMSGYAALEAARPLGIPVVVTFHALGHVKRRHQSAEDTSPAARIDVERRLVAQSDLVIATCADEVSELRGLCPELTRTAVVPCGVDTDHFTPGSRRTRREGPRRLVCVGRLVPRKGVDDAIRALSSVPDAELLVVGGPDASGLAADPEVQRLLAVAGDVGVRDRVTFTGRVGRDRLPALLRSADLAICVPWYEPFGIVPLEAMACGVPVVASAVGGLRDTVVDGVTGRHVPPHRPDLVARVVTELLDDPARLTAMRRAARERARRRYQWSQVADATLGLYESLCRTSSDAAAQL